MSSIQLYDGTTTWSPDIGPSFESTITFMTGDKIEFTEAGTPVITRRLDYERTIYELQFKYLTMTEIQSLLTFYSANAGNEITYTHWDSSTHDTVIISVEYDTTLTALNRYSLSLKLSEKT